MARELNEDDRFVWDHDASTLIVSINDGAALTLGTRGIMSSSISTRVLSASTARTTLATNQHFIVADATSADFGIVLPAAGSSVGMSYTVKKLDVSAKCVFLSGAGTDVIDGSAILGITGSNVAYTVMSDGKEWRIVSRFSGSAVG